jgi:hypothetical protein
LYSAKPESLPLQLRGNCRQFGFEISNEIVAAVHELVSIVIIRPGSNHEPEVEVYGLLNALVLPDLSGGSMVAEEGLATHLLASL